MLSLFSHGFVLAGSITNIGGSAYKCEDGSSPENKVKVISGVLGAPSSQTSIQVANLLKLFRIPQISFFSTSAALSSKERFPYFLRTIPSDVYQAEAIIALVNFFGWKYVSIVYEESSYGMSGYNELENLIGQHDICFGAREKLMKDSGVAKEEDYEAVVKNLLKKHLARGVIVFASDQEVAGLMQAVRRMGLTGRVWQAHITNSRMACSWVPILQLEGAVTVLPQAEEVQGFKEYFLSLRPDTNERNPWFTEYWEQYFGCRYPESRETPFNREYNITCTGQEQVPRDRFSMEAQLQFVSDSVLAFAYAFKEMHQVLCGGTPGLCDAMREISGQDIREHLLKVRFTGLSGQKFQFLSNGDGPSRYQILNYRRNGDGEYEWATVGYFRNGVLNITSGVQFRASEPLYPPSVCKRKCGRRQAIDIDTVEPCCSSCKDCQKYQYRPEPTRCEECPMGTLPSYNMSMCLEIPPIYLTFTDATALVAMTFSTLGILAITFTGVVFLLHANTPVVKASGRELSFVLLLGIFLCYTMTFLLITKPSKLVCGAQTIGIGFCFSVCYSAILTKTNRIARIFRAGERTTR
ncbi:metabotropic glutamate receptor [Elysia marginata]|uniref:Metabotropic glutamate receptor n=1 Tax=Elysia marginata TaxID=1093978 RepID=A0AAV4JPK6_9GAST|nr:metabotropic glutamate receptor [Elysia marginata]